MNRLQKRAQRILLRIRYRVPGGFRVQAFRVQGPLSCKVLGFRAFGFRVL